MMAHFKAVCLALALLEGCTNATTYGPASKPGGYGFSQQKIEENRYQITFNGNSATSRQTVENSLMYRAAELTLEMGYDYFIVAERDVEAKTRSAPSRFHTPFYGRFVFVDGRRGTYVSFPYYAFGFGWGHPHDGYGRDITRYSAVSYIVMHKGSKPSGILKAFDARDVSQSLRSLVLSYNDES